MFGTVVDGMDVIKKVGQDYKFNILPTCLQIEGLGSRSGKTSKKVVIEDCGEID